ncbi:Hypothetical_protein [Hexamita inflata]|uniref:Hypothetical_protein n=1 Tax=Hexamita inflata TaxID=28002 RepID=A0AA86PSY9_9EUKA|nr:Hypothetical protein HINF_LOCUS33244 [Hexamita inflata]
MQSGQITFSQPQYTFYSLYTEKIQDFTLKFTHSVKDLPSFALFGFTADIMTIDSNIQVKITEQLAEGALLCLQCNLNIQSSDLLFVASGQNISGLVLIVKVSLQIKQSLVQQRLTGCFVGGLILYAKNSELSMQNSNISVYCDSLNISGSLIVFVNGPAAINIQSVRICNNSIQFIGDGLSIITDIT